jgi:very-short-patch-repair endonuclease
VVLEADGRMKYRGDELWREKLRQERLERLGYRVIRVLWRDVMYRPTETIARIRRALLATWPTS